MSTEEVIDTACNGVKGYLLRHLVDGVPVSVPLELKLLTLEGPVELIVTLRDKRLHPQPGRPQID